MNDKVYYKKKCEICKQYQLIHNGQQHMKICKQCKNNNKEEKQEGNINYLIKRQEINKEAI